jgi:hypothetical protein
VSRADYPGLIHVAECPSNVRPHERLTLHAHGFMVRPQRAFESTVFRVIMLSVTLEPSPSARIGAGRPFLWGSGKKEVLKIFEGIEKELAKVPPAETK